MLRITLWLYVGVFVWGSVSCSIKCPDGAVCPDSSTCCWTPQGYSCCPYPKAVCCADKAHCCPQGRRCNLAKQTCEKADQPWMNIPMVKSEPAQEPSTSEQEPSTPELAVTPLQESSNVPEQIESSVVRCDSVYVCPDRTTCCRHPTGVWFCCGYTYGKCCLDGFHCCPHGYDCDLTYTHCLKIDMKYLSRPKPALTSVPASLLPTSDMDHSETEKPLTALVVASSSSSSSSLEHGVIRCDSNFYCPAKTTCCKGLNDQWTCCPYQLGTCCADGKHCCQYGYTCDATSSTCRKI